MDRYKARDEVTKEMENLGFFEGKEDRDIPLKFSDRSKTPIEPYLSEQWFVRMGETADGKPGLAQMSMEAVTAAVCSSSRHAMRRPISIGSAKNAIGASAGNCGGGIGFPSGMCVARKRC